MDVIRELHSMVDTTNGGGRQKGASEDEISYTEFLRQCGPGA